MDTITLVSKEPTDKLYLPVPKNIALKSNVIKQALESNVPTTKPNEIQIDLNKEGLQYIIEILSIKPFTVETVADKLYMDNQNTSKLYDLLTIADYYEINELIIILRNVIGEFLRNPKYQTPDNREILKLVTATRTYNQSYQYVVSRLKGYDYSYFIDGSIPNEGEGVVINFLNRIKNNFVMMMFPFGEKKGEIENWNDYITEKFLEGQMTKRNIKKEIKAEKAEGRDSILLPLKNLKQYFNVLLHKINGTKYFVVINPDHSSINIDVFKDLIQEDIVMFITGNVSFNTTMKLVWEIFDMFVPDISPDFTNIKEYQNPANSNAILVIDEEYNS